MYIYRIYGFIKKIEGQIFNVKIIIKYKIEILKQVKNIIIIVFKIKNNFKNIKKYSIIF